MMIGAATELSEVHTHTTALYQEMIEHFMPPSADKLYQDGGLIL